MAGFFYKENANHKRNPRQVSEKRLKAALKLNCQIAAYFSYVYSIPDKSSLEDVGLEAIAQVCSKIKKTRRHKGFLSFCNLRIRSRVVRYINKCDKENYGKIRAAMIVRRYVGIYMGNPEQRGDYGDQDKS